MKPIDSDGLKQIQLRILEGIDKYCRENGIGYFLYAGTLLGAVRHKGYIPWDDDIDICMKREDYDRFFADFNKKAHSGLRAIRADIDDGYYLVHGKVIDSRTVMHENTSSGFEIGVYVDIFPIDRFSGDIAAFRKKDKRANRYRKLLLIKNLKTDKRRSFTKNAAVFLGHLFLKPVGTSYLIKKINELSLQSRDDDGCNIWTDFASFVPGERFVFDSGDFKDTVLLEFEGKRYPAPAAYDSVLTKMYGDYMTPPPPEQRKTHHDYEAYIK